MKMKRKDLDDVNDQFSDFSLFSPARKSRRLDAELPPILEEEEPKIPLAFEQSGGAPVVEESPSVPVNEERAIVVFKTMNTPLLHSPSNFSVSIDPDIIAGFKNFWSSQSNCIKPEEDEAATQKNSMATKGCLAVVPWVPSQVFQTPGMEVSQAEASELMEAEEMEAAVTMEIESNDESTVQGQANEFDGERGSGVLPQWQQQHCMTPQLLQNTPTPIVWYR